MAGGPHGWLASIDLLRHKSPEATHLIVAGDTSNHVQDTLDVLNAVSRYYHRVIAVAGNHETGLVDSAKAQNVTILTAATPFVEGGIGYAGGMLDAACDVATVETTIRGFVCNPKVTRLIVVSHLAPTPRIGDLLGVDIRHKANDLLDRVGRLHKQMDVVFGHIHLKVDLTLDGAKVRSNPRGYRGKLRDGSAWSGRFASFR